ncbi:MAG: TonB-dependent siderophore receptor [Aphanocapsa sp. GSE-SYN-MK-11-07L]|nr:TonB-dependent siderophore receptor [Aphanocapsa sp. GSE-SYN-MK-11-07L]
MNYFQCGVANAIAAILSVVTSQLADAAEISPLGQVVVQQQPAQVGDRAFAPKSMTVLGVDQQSTQPEIIELQDFSSPATTVKDWLAQTEEADRAAQITAVKLNRTETELEIVLETADGKALPIDASKFTSEGNALIAEIPNAVLALPDGQSFQADNPAPDIAKVSVEQQSPNNIRITVSGDKTLPKTAVVLKTGAFSYSLNPDLEGSEAEIVVTGQGAENYFVPDATTATKTDTPLRDIPQSIQVIPEQVLKDQQVRRLNDAVQNVSGVQQDDTFGGQIDRINIRGFQTDVFLQDGIRQSQFSNRETNNLERIEVLKGPASVLYGSLEPGGVVNLVTKKPLAEPFYEVDLSVGSYAFIRPSIDLSGPLNSDKTILYRFNALYEYNNGFRDFQTDTNRVFTAPTLSWKISDKTDLTLEFSYLNDLRPFDEGTVAIGNAVADLPRDRVLSDATNRRTVEEFKVGYRFEHRFNQDWKLRNSFRYLSSDTFDFRLGNWFIEDDGTFERKFLSNQDNYQNFSVNTDLIGKFKTGFVEHTLLVGLDLNRETTAGNQRRLPDNPGFFTNIFTGVTDPLPAVSVSDMTDFGRDGSRAQNRLGLYLQDQVEILENLKLLVGGRLDLYRRTSLDRLSDTTTEDSAQRFSPRVGIVYQPIEPISLYTSFSQSFNPDIFSTQVDGSALEPSVGTQYEVGVKGEFLDKKLFTTLAAYQINKTNISTTDPNNPDFSLAVGEAQSQGIELDIIGEPIQGWNIIAAYAYTNAEITQDNFFTVGNRLANVPKHSASLWSTYQIQAGPAKGIGFGLGFLYVGDRFGDTGNSFILPSYLRTDAALYYRRDKFKIGLNFQNLFNVEYFKSAAFRESIYVGDPFTVIGSVSIEF